METPKKVTSLTPEEFYNAKRSIEEDEPRRFVYPSVKEKIPNRKEEPTLEEVLGAVARQRAKEILAKEVLERNQDQNVA
jgi:hypothetical protein